MTKLFLSYNRRDAAGLANRLRTDLEKLGYEVWQVTREIRAGKECAERFSGGQRSTKMISTLPIPRAVRRISVSI